jgi:hypothetical protein
MRPALSFVEAVGLGADAGRDPGVLGLEMAASCAFEECEPPVLSWSMSNGSVASMVKNARFNATLGIWGYFLRFDREMSRMTQPQLECTKRES